MALFAVILSPNYFFIVFEQNGMVEGARESFDLNPEPGICLVLNLNKLLNLREPRSLHL